MKRDFSLLILFSVLGVGAAYVSVNIPGTKAYIEGRWIFGFLGFVLIRRLPIAAIIPVILSLAGFHRLPIHIVLAGNLLYAVPFCFFLRVLYRRLLRLIENHILFGVCWFFAVFAGYQLFTTPAIQAVLGLVNDCLSLPFFLDGFREQYFFGESIGVALLSTLVLIIARMYFVLQGRKEYLDMILLSIGDGIIVMDTESRIKIMNPMAEKLTGWTTDLALNHRIKDIFSIIDERTGEFCQNPVEKVLSTGEAFSLNQTTLIARDGRERYVANCGAPIRNEDGNIDGVVLIFRDVTEEYDLRKQIKNDLREKEILLQEVHHRVKNNLQIISSLISLQTDVLHDPVVIAMLQDLKMRVFTMSLVHNQLYQSDDYLNINLKDYLEKLSEEFLLLYKGHQDVHITIDVPQTILSIQTIIPCGLILNELLSNSMKHAFSDSSSGQICISCRKEGADYILRYSDNGKGMDQGVEARTTHSIGLLLVESLVEQLDGTIEKSTEDGVNYLITFPAEAKTEKNNRDEI